MRRTSPGSPVDPATAPVAYLTAASFDGATRQQTPALVDFGADWCPPCRAIAPVLDQLALEEASRLQVYKIDVDASPEIADRFGVTGLPTLILFQDGEPVERLTGYRAKAQLAAALAPHLNPAPAPGGGAPARVGSGA